MLTSPRRAVQLLRKKYDTLAVIGVAPVPPGPPTYSDSEIGDVDTLTVEVQFSENVNSLNFMNGVTIRINAIAQAIVSGTRQADHSIVWYVIPAADVNDIVDFAYDDAFGDIVDDDGNPLADVLVTVSTNYIGSHLYFDTEWDCVWTAAV